MTLNAIASGMSSELYRRFVDGQKVLVRAVTISGDVIEFAIADNTKNNYGVGMTVAFTSDGRYPATVNLAALAVAAVVDVVKETP